MWFSAGCIVIDNEYASSQWSKYDHFDHKYPLSIKVQIMINHIRSVKQKIPLSLKNV